MQQWQFEHGSPAPLGATWCHNGFNFALFSSAATGVILLLFADDNFSDFTQAYELDIISNRTGDIWHCFIPADKLGDAKYYAYMVNGPDISGNRFMPHKLLLDPWAKGVFFPPEYSRQAAYGSGSNMGKAALGCLIKEPPHLPAVKGPRHTNDLVIYEMHVRGFTVHESSGVPQRERGTFRGIVSKIPYLKDLGVTAVELLPVHQYDPQEKNYWGYMTLNFFTPHSRYCCSQDALEQIAEFKEMVAALHEAGIEVILDVVYNHTAEEDKHGPTYAYRGIDNVAYYLLGNGYEYYNDTGTGNTLRLRHRIVRQLVLDSMRYWVQEMGVDGFRFDLASIFSRNDDGSVNTYDPPLVQEISMDPVLCNTRLIAEPWDIGAYQLGHGFPGKGWSQWNDKYRDDVRRFVRGDNGMVGKLMTRLYGSDDLFPAGKPHFCHPYQSINFVTAHDGFCLYDLVSYNHKRNHANGYNNADGTEENYSWNCGHEGDEGVSAEVDMLRRRQAKNFFAILLLSNGIPMITMGDEFLHTHQGNNNPYNQDNEINWLNWSRKKEYGDVYRFCREMIAFRKRHPSLCQRDYWQDDITWYGTNWQPDVSDHSHTLAFYLSGERFGCSDLYVMINAYGEPLEFTVQEGVAAEWVPVINTAAASPADIGGKTKVITIGLHYTVAERSVVVLERKRPA